jgi:hypothetical protein
VREERKLSSATGGSGNSNSGTFQRLNIARIYRFSRLPATIARPVKCIEPNPLNPSNGLIYSAKAPCRYLATSLHESRNVNLETS